MLNVLIAKRSLDLKIDKSKAIELIESNDFQFAKTMKTIPHSYTLKEKWKNLEDFNSVVLWIRENGVPEQFMGKSYIYFYYAGFKYWTMGNSLEITKLINKAKDTDLKISLVEITEEMKKTGEKNGLVFCSKTVYYGVFKKNIMVGFFGLLIGSNILTIKNIYVNEEHRGNGYFKYMLNEIINVNTKKNIKATCTKYSIKHFLKKGFAVIENYKNGCTGVIYEIL